MRALIAAILTLLLLVADPAQAIVLSDRNEDHIVQPGQPKYGVTLDGVVALGTGAVGKTSLQDIVVFNCSGALITDFHILTAAHCLDSDHDGELDSLLTGFGYYAGFQLSDRELLLEVDLTGDPWPSSWPNEIAGLNVASPDIAVLHLSEAAPPEIPRYPLYVSVAIGTYCPL